MKLPDVPLSMAPEVIQKFYLRDRLNGGQLVADPALAGIETSMRVALEEITRVHAVALKPDPTLTPAAWSLRTRDIAIKAAEKSAGRLDAARAAAMADVERIRSETSAPPVPRDPNAVQLAAEIRQRLASMPDKDRSAMIAAAVANGDDTVLGAVLTGPAWLSGMGDAEREMRRAAWRRERFPQQVDREMRLGKAIEAVDRAGRSMLRWTREIAESPSTQLAQAGKDRADRAIAALQAGAE